MRHAERVRIRRWTRREYERMIDRGIFRPDDRLELIDGQMVVKVSKTRLAFDRARKATLYARNGVEDYWIVNVLDRVLEVYREPSRGGRAGYGSVRTLSADESVTPLAVPAARILVADLLP